MKLRTLDLVTIAGLSAAIVVGGTMTIVSAQQRGGPTTAPYTDAESPRLLALGNRGVQSHDPSTIVKDKDEYWIFRTGRGTPSYRSKDLVNWQAGPVTFNESPTWVAQAVPGNRGGRDFWAPDVMKVGDRFLLYYSVSTFGSRNSVIALASNPTLDPDDPRYKWTDQGIIVQTSDQSNYNAIDPAIISDPADGLWMVFGSFWSGIKLIQLDPATGKRIAPDSPMYSLAHYSSIEAAYIYKHEGYYYLFVNWGRCCQGNRSTYEIRVGRSQKITGPYLDTDGKDLASDGGTQLLATDRAFIGPGHAGILKEGDKYWLSMHFYNGTTNRGTSMLAIRPLTWGVDGWPVVQTPRP